MNHGSAPIPLQGKNGREQSGNSAGRGMVLDPALSNADIGFEFTPPWGQE